MSDTWQRIVNWSALGRWETDAERDERFNNELRQQQENYERRASEKARALAEQLKEIGYNKQGPSNNCFLYVKAQRARLKLATPGWNHAAEIIQWIEEFPDLNVPPTNEISAWWRQVHEKHTDVKTAQQMADLYNETHPNALISVDQFFRVSRGAPKEVGAIMLEINEVSSRIGNNDVGHVSLVDDLENPSCKGGWHIREANYPYGYYHETCVFPSDSTQIATGSAVVKDPFFLYGGARLKGEQ